MAATFPSSPEPKKASLLPCSPKAEKAGLFPGWVLLDRIGRTHCYDDPDAASSAVRDDAMAVAVHTTNGQSGYFSFTLRAPPMVSYVDLHWPYGMPKSIFDPPAYPFVLSADENHLLLRIGFDKEYREGPNIFVYTVGASSPPSLRRLPACTKMAQGLVVRNEFIVRNEFMLVDTEMGILCRGGNQDDYVVADLILHWKARGTPGCYDYYRPSQPIASLGVFSSREGEWAVKEIHGQGEGEFPSLWECDRVLPFAGRFLCWIDYYNGILLCDLSNDKSPMLYYKPFPGKQYPVEDHLNRGWPEASRSVSVSQGMMRFVDIDKEGTITIWNFEIAGNNFTWEMQNVINLGDLWAQQGYQVEHLPCRAPEFPTVAKNDPDVLFCILGEHEFVQPGKVWIMIIDMKHTTFRSCFRYVDEKIVCCNKDLDMDSESCLCIPPFLLPADFSKYLNSPSAWKWCEIWLPFGKKFHALGIAAITWSIWKARNKTCFEQKIVQDPISITLAAGVNAMLKIALQLIRKKPKTERVKLLEDKEEDCDGV